MQKMATALVDAVSKNLGQKAIALALAVLVWYIIGQEITDRVDLDLPFRVTLAPTTDLEILGQSQWMIHVTVRGPRSDIQRIRATSWTIEGTHRLEAVELPAGRDDVLLSIPVTAERFTHPATSLLLSGFDPAEVQVHVGRTGRKRLPVIPVVTGKPAEGYVVAEVPRAVPAKVQVRGPLLVLRNLEEIRTKTVEIDGYTSRLTQRTALVTRIETRAGTFELECEEGEVEVSVAIQEVPAETVLQRVPVRIVLPPSFPGDRFSVRAKEEVRDVTVRGPKPLLQNLDASNVYLVADVKPDVSEAWFESTESVPRDAVLRGWIVGLPREAAARLEVIPDRPETTYILTRIKK
jgi:hypothetical protein